MYNDKLDIKSPYIKNNNDEMDAVRKRIARRTLDHAEEKRNILSLSERGREESDDMLQQKIQKVSKRIVGEEIRKFAEVASSEISSEFERLEKSLDRKIEALEEDIHNNLLLQNENLATSEEDIEEKINAKLFEINSVLDQMESRIKDLEVYTLAEKPENAVSVEVSCEDPVLEEKEEVYSLNLSRDEKEDGEEERKEVKKEITEEYEEEKEEKKVEKEEYKKEKEEDGRNDDEEESDDDEKKEKYKDEAEYDKKEKYVKEKIKKIGDKFEKNGFLFKKNTFFTVLEKLNAKDFLKEKKEFRDVDEKDREKLLDILNDLVEDSGSEPKKDETIKQFLKRIYRKKYEKKD